MPPVHRIHRPGVATTEDITDYARLYSVEVTANAEEGSVAISSQVLDDPLADLDHSGGFQYQILESTATGSNQYIYVGGTVRKTFRRGTSPRTSLRTTVQREVEFELADINTLLSNYIITESWGNRPAETDVARIQAALNAGIINLDDTRFVSTANPFQMPANDYRGQTNYALFDDCAQESGKNWFIWWAGDIEGTSLWYDFSSSSNYSSPLRLSNVLSDIDSTWTFEISQDTTLVRDASRVYSHIYLPWQNGAAFVGNFATQAEFSIRHASMDGYNVKTQAQANARANRYLAQASTEEDIVTTTVRLPAAKVNFLMQGMRVQFRASHLPGYEDTFTWFRVLRRTVTQEDELNYSVRLEMTATPSVGTSCAVTLASLDVVDNGIPEGPFGGTEAGNPVTPGTGDYLALVFFALGENGTTFTNGGTMHVDSPWSSLSALPTTGNPGHTESVVGYRSNATGTPNCDWVGQPAADGRQASLLIPTAATAPTQSVHIGNPGGIDGTDGDIDFPSTPTGLLILFRVGEGPTGFTSDPTGADWVQLFSFDGALQNAGSNFDVWACCAPADASDLDSGIAGSSWWAHCLEVALT